MEKKLVPKKHLFKIATMKGINKDFFIFFGLSLAVFSVWLFAFYPVIMTYDSLTVWKEISSKNFTNWHPYIYTLSVYVLTLGGKYPSLLSIIQVLGSSLIAAFGFSFLYKKAERKWIVIVAFALFITSVQVGLYNVTAWKDVIFTELLVGWALYIYYLIKSNKIIRFTPITYLIVIASLFLLGSVKHGSFVYLVGIGIVLFFAKLITRRELAIASTIIGTLLVVSHFILPSILKVDMDNTVNASSFKIQVIAAIARNKRQDWDWRNRVQINKFENIIPISHLTSSYYCRRIDPIIFTPNFDYKALKGKYADIDSIFWRLIPLNVPEIASDRACVISSVLTGGTFLYNNLLDVPVTRAEFGQNVKITGIEATKPIKKKLLKLTEKATEGSYNYFLRSLVLPLSIFIYSLFTYKRDKAFFYFSLVMVLPLPLILLTLPGDDYRYLYYLSYGFYFSLPMFIPSVGMVIRDTLKRLGDR